MWITIGLVIVGFVVFSLTRGFFHLRHSQKVALREIAGAQLSQVPALAQECVSIFAEHFGESLSLDDFDASARSFGSRLDASDALINAFSKDEFHWYFVLPCGAFLGELLRRRIGGEWRIRSDGAPELHLARGDSSLTTFPFDKVMKHVELGNTNDMYSYIVAAPELVQGLRSETT